MIKKKSYLLILLSILLIFTTVPVNAANNITYNIKADERAYQYEWRYKFENGFVYRRLYNCTTQQWAGNWELVG
ncbi:hypothetical protein EDD76_108150 [Kineothrix alysoides]|uniref:Carbohydrate binding protein n=1 Tax=Kineothrix alysoides TaxID=1469948 RepID=A0A4R1QX20_9FIRM|nr:hypothetical protein [Kineothrix alysoides]TCL57615.1 hypothetical protein EDD76_108150 [Kineothrix alysoides]